MPYVVRKRGEKWACLNPESGRVYGEHESEESALAQARALYVNAPPDEEEKEKKDGEREPDEPDDEGEDGDEPDDDECVKGEDGSCLTHKDGKCKRAENRGDADWDESKHPRDHGKFSSAPGSSGGSDGAWISTEGSEITKAHRGGYYEVPARARLGKFEVTLHRNGKQTSIGKASSREVARRMAEAHRAEERKKAATSGANSLRVSEQVEKAIEEARQRRLQAMARPFKKRSDGQVRRFDILERLDGPTLLPNGWLKADAHIARTGIQEYRRGDGSVRRELRLPDDVFHGDALASFSMLPVTDDHPPDGLLDSENTRKYQRGHLGETVTQDGHRVKAPVLITDADLVKKVLAGKTQLSCGYVCDLDETPGEWEGQRFDAVQRAIRGNHVAVVARARGGPELRLKLDSRDAVSIRADREPDEPLAATSTAQERTTMTVKMQIDGIEGVEVANEQAAQLIGRALQARDQRADAAEKALKAVREDADKAAAQANANAEALRARATVAESKVAELEKARKDAEDALPNRVRERVALLEQARGVLGPEAKFDNLDALAIKKTVITKIQPDIKLDGESADFVNGIYQASILAHAKRVAQVGLSEARRLNGPARLDGETIDAEAAREKARKDSEEEWKKPLSAAK